MLPVIPKPAISKKQKAAALAVAGGADFLQLMVFPLFGEGIFSPLQDVLDIVTAIALIAICGFKWQFVLAFLLELVPIADILPTWTAVALLLRTHEESGPGPVNVTAVPPRTREMVDADAVVVPPVQAPPVRGQG